MKYIVVLIEVDSDDGKRVDQETSMLNDWIVDDIAASTSLIVTTIDSYVFDYKPTFSLGNIGN